MIEIVTGIVVKEVDYRDTSKIIEVFTKKYGIISLMARGAKKVKSPLFKGTTYLSLSDFCIYKKGSIHILKSVNLINNYKNILQDIVKISASNYIINLSIQVYKQHFDNDIYDFLINFLNKINDGLDTLGIINIAEIKYLEYLGVSPNLDSCVICSSKDITNLSVDHAGFLCSNCSKVSMDKKLLKLIRLYAYVDISKLDNLNIDKKLLLELDKFITAYYEKYTGLFIKSKSFFIDMYKK